MLSRPNLIVLRRCVASLVAASPMGASILVAQAGAAPPAAAPAAAVPAPATAPVRAKVTETLLYQIPDGAKVADTVCSPDGRHVGCVETAGGKFAVVVDGVRSPPLEWVVGRSFGFSQEGGRFAFLTQHDGLMYAVVGQAPAAPGGTAPAAIAAPAAPPAWSAAEQQPGGYLVGRVLLSPDGKRSAFGVQKQKDGKMTMVVDGAEQAPVDELYAADMQFSPDGKRFAYRARVGKQVMYVVDGVAQPPADAVGGLTFSPDGGRYAYAAKAGADAGEWVDGQPPAKRYPFVGGLVFSPDGKRYAYVVETAAGPATAPGAAGGPPGAAATNPAATRPAVKQQLVYNAGQGEQAFAPFDAIGAVAFSPDGRRLALTALSNRQWNLVLDGKLGQAYDGIGSMLLFSPDSKRLAYAAGRSGAAGGGGAAGAGGAAGGAARQFLVVDGKESDPVEVVGPATFSPDGQRVSHVVIAGRERWLMLDGRRIGPATFAAFTPDSKHLAHALTTPDGKGWTLAVDGQPVGPTFQGFPVGSKLVWESPTVGRVIAGRETQMFMVRVELQP